MKIRPLAGRFAEVRPTSDMEDQPGKRWRPVAGYEDKHSSAD